MNKKTKLISCVVISIIICIIAVGTLISANTHQSVSDRDVFAECALVAQSQMNCYGDRHIKDYSFINDLRFNFIGYCFNFDGGGYVIVTAYDYKPWVVEPDKPSPFPTDFDMTFDEICIFSTQPVSAKLCNTKDKDSGNLFRTFSGINCCFVMKDADTYTDLSENADHRVLSASTGERFYYTDIIEPIVNSKPIVSVGKERLNEYEILSVPNEQSRSVAVALSKKQMSDFGYSLEDFAKEVNSLRSLYEWHSTIPWKYDRSTYYSVMSNSKLRNALIDFECFLENLFSHSSKKGKITFNDFSEGLSEDTFDLRK